MGDGSGTPAGRVWVVAPPESVADVDRGGDGGGFLCVLRGGALPILLMSHVGLRCVALRLRRTDSCRAASASWARFTSRCSAKRLSAARVRPDPTAGRRASAGRGRDNGRDPRRPRLGCRVRGSGRLVGVLERLDPGVLPAGEDRRDPGLRRVAPGLRGLMRAYDRADAASSSPRGVWGWSGPPRPLSE